MWWSGFSILLILSIMCPLPQSLLALDDTTLSLRQLRRDLEYVRDGIRHLVHISHDMTPFLKLLVKDVHGISENLLNHAEDDPLGGHEKLFRAINMRSKIKAMANSSLTLFCQDPQSSNGSKSPVKQISWLKMATLDPLRDLPPGSPPPPTSTFLMSSTKVESARNLHVLVDPLPSSPGPQAIYQCRLHLQNGKIARHTFLVESVVESEHECKRCQSDDEPCIGEKTFTRHDFWEVELQSQDSISMLCKSNANLEIYEDPDQPPVESQIPDEMALSDFEKIERVDLMSDLESICILESLDISSGLNASSQESDPRVLKDGGSTSSERSYIQWSKNQALLACPMVLAPQWPHPGGNLELDILTLVNAQSGDEGYYTCNRLTTQQVIHHRNLFGELPRDLVTPKGHSECLNDPPTGMHLTIKEPWQN